MIDELRKVGANVRYDDPWVPKFGENGQTMTGESELSLELLENSDLVMITCGHTNVYYAFVQKHARLIFDTKNVTKALGLCENIEGL